MIVHIFTNFLGALAGPVSELFPQAQMILFWGVMVIRAVFFFMLFFSFRKLYGKKGKWCIDKDTPEKKSRSWKYLCTSLCLPMLLVLLYLLLS